MSNGAYTAVEKTRSRDIRVVVIGAGMSGLCMASTLRHRGITNFTVYEKADEVGGTWRDNTYPTCNAMCPHATTHIRSPRTPAGVRDFHRDRRYTSTS